MAINTNPIFPGIIEVAVAQISTANTNRDGTGTLVDVVTADAYGTRIDRVVIIAPGTTTAGVVRLFLYDGTNNRLLDEVLISAITPSTTLKVAYYELRRADGSPVAFLPPNTNWKLKASTHNAETFNVIAYCGDYSIAA